jgi:hypothetical protein
MRSLLFGLLTLLSPCLIAQENEFNAQKKYSPDSLKRWAKSLFVESSRKHPGFYRYTPKEKFDYLIDSTAQTITDSLTELEYYRKLKPLFAQIGCLHTGVTLSESYQNYLDKTPTLLPLEVFIDADKRILITKSYAVNQNLPIGGELLSINSNSISGILEKLLRAIPSDGFNETEKVLLLNHRFSFWYQTIIEVTPTFTVEIKKDEVVSTYLLAGTSSQAFPSMVSTESSDENVLEFNLADGTGILTIHSFAKTTIKAHGQSFKKFIKATFRELKKMGIENLIIDLRYNTGGSDGNAAYLASYFFDKPFRYWEKIEVTEAVAKEIKGVNRLFYKKPVKVDSSYRWRKSWATKDFDYYKEQQPAKGHFEGRTYLITNGLCMSSCADITAILSHNNLAKVIGQETGGGFQGNTSGIMPTVEIPTGLQITIPLQKYTNAVDPNKNFGHGIIPDFEIAPTFDDWVSKTDTEMEFVMELIREN